MKTTSASVHARPSTSLRLVPSKVREGCPGAPACTIRGPSDAEGDAAADGAGAWLAGAAHPVTKPTRAAMPRPAKDVRDRAGRTTLYGSVEADFEASFRHHTPGGRTCRETAPRTRDRSRTHDGPDQSRSGPSPLPSGPTTCPAKPRGEPTTSRRGPSCEAPCAGCPRCGNSRHRRRSRAAPGPRS